jgi:hypothetical protein
MELMSKNCFTWITAGCLLAAAVLSPHLSLAASAAADPQSPAPSLEVLQRQWTAAAEAFLKEHPDLKSFDSGSLESRREAARLWNERSRELLLPWTASRSTSTTLSDPEAKQGSVSTWPSESKAVPQTAGDASPRDRSTPQASAMLPNEIVTPLGGPQNSVNSSVAMHGVILNEAYGVRTDFLGGPLGAPAAVGVSGTPFAGSGAAWLPLGGIPMVAGLPNQWNPTITYGPPITPLAYLEAHVEYALPALAIAPSAIIVTPSVGSGGPFPTGAGPSVVAFSPGPGFWLDYPCIVSNNHPGNPVGPGGRGDLHVAWVQYAGGAADVNGNGVLFDDPGDGYQIMAASSNTFGGGPFPYPAFSAPVPIFAGPIQPGAHQLVRPSLSTAGPAGTPAGPPSILYAAWIDPGLGAVMVSFNPVPGLGAPWGPVVPAAPVALLPVVLNGGIKSSSSVSIAVDDGPLFPGFVYIVWSDYTNGDADIFFSRSVNGGLAWSVPMRVNQDPLGNGRDQWAPHMVVNATTGEVVITYFDRRNDPANVMIQTWSSSSMTGGATWTDGVVSNIGPLPPAPGLVYPPGIYIGDYLGSSADYGYGINPWGAIWNDGRMAPFSEVFFEVVRGIDSDGDGIPDAVDNCPFTPNPGQADSDGDGTGDACDGCLTDPNKTSPGICGCGVPDTDSDGDAVPDCVDNCPTTPNPLQADADSDGYGDVCDNCPQIANPNQAITILLTGDLNLSGTLTSSDVILLVNYVFKSGAPPVPCPAAGDCNCSGTVSSADIITLVNYVFKGGPAPCNVCTAPGLGWSCP